ncbi:ImmA/IrrE family metallo-endopeptidase [uncultured Erythrobacter sp.]|uniref:ImmA/IrrE family metallo-endopeptidase n=1 Tax=uncultured Erythrobacter sp. TaxID=263913 RepID=UPI00262325D9|nr:ImmA/IrrE family metallo-endopeptidase [uncultured Erythrobacter sp.]
MTLSRLDLDGTSSPRGLVTKILKALPSLSLPMPIEDIARALDIAEIEEIETEGFVGGLVTDDARSSGGILVQKGLGRQRRRFTIAHELGHFLIPFHRPVTGEQFMCDSAAMRAWDEKTKKGHYKMEAEANRFASTLLVPPPLLREFLKSYRTADMKAAIDVHREFDVSKVVAARCYAEYSGERVAFVVTRNGKVLYNFRNREFPWIVPTNGAPIPSGSRFHSHRGSDISPLLSVGAEHWIETEFGKRVPFMKEQVLPQANGHALIMLWMDVDDDDYDPEEAMTSKQRLEYRTAERS